MFKYLLIAGLISSAAAQEENIPAPKTHFQSATNLEEVKYESIPYGVGYDGHALQRLYYISKYPWFLSKDVRSIKLDSIPNEWVLDIYSQVGVMSQVRFLINATVFLSGTGFLGLHFCSNAGFFIQGLLFGTCAISSVTAYKMKQVESKNVGLVKKCLTPSK